ncbi:MAG: 16S rRNA (guanine(966)-N(2))-methyltransferase RsmD [Candidatus Margulisiibacteriota bacterium]
MKTPKKGWNLRPLTERAREALFNILGTKVVDSTFLDLFAGTGAVGIEALSRGAKIAFFVEKMQSTVALIRKNLELTGFSDQAEVYALDVIRALNLFKRKKAKFDIIFMGAPYDSPILAKALKKFSETEILNDNGLLIVEHRRQHKIEGVYGGLEKFREEHYGETVLSFYKLQTEE